LLATAAGTLAFKPPEAFAERKGDSCAADVWAIGATLYLLLTDLLPFTIPADVNWQSKNLFDKPITPPSQINPDVNRDLDSIVLKTLEKKSTDRYPTAKELLTTLDNWKPGKPDVSSKAKSLSTEASKTVLGVPTPANETKADELTQKAFQAKKAGRLAEAADLMEEAFNKSPELRHQYAHQVKLWRCGISM
jgi:serine/threonine-protein kinase